MDDAKRGANATLTIDLEAQEIRGPDGGVVKFEIDPFRKHCLLEGLDDIGLTLQKADHDRRLRGVGGGAALGLTPVRPYCKKERGFCRPRLRGSRRWPAREPALFDSDSRLRLPKAFSTGLDPPRETSSRAGRRARTACALRRTARREQATEARPKSPTEGWRRSRRRRERRRGARGPGPRPTNSTR